MGALTVVKIADELVEAVVEVVRVHVFKFVHSGREVKQPQQVAQGQLVVGFTLQGHQRMAGVRSA